MYLTGNNSDSVIGAIYSMQVNEKALLDQFEGPGYRCESMRLEIAGEARDCFVYIAEDSHIDDDLVPHCWYKNIVLLGAEFHNLPESYLEQIRQVKAATDPDEGRHRMHYELIDQMKDYKIVE